MERPVRFTAEQVLAGIQSYVSEHVDEKLIVDPDTSVNDYRKAVKESHDCPLWFLMELAGYFGLRWDSRRWGIWLRLPRPNKEGDFTNKEQKRRWEEWQEQTSQSITVRDLAAYIARRAHGVSMDPITVFGRTCVPAGVFGGLCELPEVRGRRIGPSTQIRSVMRAGTIEQFWRRAAWVGGRRLPELKSRYIGNARSRVLITDVVGISVASVVAVLALAIFVLPPTPMTCFVLIASVFIGIPAYCVTAWLEERCRNTLPSGIETFGDLARLIADATAPARPQTPA